LTLPALFASKVYVLVRCLSVLSIDSDGDMRLVGLMLSALHAGDIDRQLRAPALRTSYRSMSSAGALAQQQMRVASC